MTHLDYVQDDASGRLRYAREKAGFASAKAAAEALGMKPGTYRAYERAVNSSKHINLDHQTAIQIGRAFGVRWEWLLTGAGEPYDPGNDPGPIPSSPADRIIRAMRGQSPAQQEAIAAAVEALTLRA